jgi:hypothetical protein
MLLILIVPEDTDPDDDQNAASRSRLSMLSGEAPAAPWQVRAEGLARTQFCA